MGDISYFSRYINHVFFCWTSPRDSPHVRRSAYIMRFSPQANRGHISSWMAIFSSSDFTRKNCDFTRGKIWKNCDFWGKIWKKPCSNSYSTAFLHAWDVISDIHTYSHCFTVIYGVFHRWEPPARSPSRCRVRGSVLGPPLLCSAHDVHPDDPRTVHSMAEPLHPLQSLGVV